MKRSVVAACISLSLVACSDEPTIRTALGNSALGVVEFTLTETGSTLDVLGGVAYSQPIASLHLRMGDVSIADEELYGYGRELDVEIGDARAQHQSVGVLPVLLPHLGNPLLNQFLLDPSIADALAGWGVTL